MRHYGVAVGGLVFALASGQGAWAGPQGEAGPGGKQPGGGQTEEGTPVTDDVIVDVMIRTEKVVQRTAAVGTKKSSQGGVRDVAKRVHSGTRKMVDKLQSYAQRRGYNLPVSTADPADREVEQQVSEMLTALEALDNQQFSPTFLAVMHGLVEQMLELLSGAQQAANDPALRDMLRARAETLAADQAQLEVILLQQAPPPASPPSSDEPMPIPSRQ
jgi:hypothetical protein